MDRLATLSLLYTKGEVVAGRPERYYLGISKAYGSIRSFIVLSRRLLSASNYDLDGG